MGGSGQMQTRYRFGSESHRNSSIDNRAFRLLSSAAYPAAILDGDRTPLGSGNEGHDATLDVRSVC